MNYSFFILYFLLGSSSTFSQSENNSFSDLEFISGYWVYSDSLTFFEEIWSENRADELMGSFRMIKNGKSIFYEFMTIEKNDTTIQLLLRHYSPGLKGWEEKETPLVFLLESKTNDKAVFKQMDKSTWLIYELTEKEKLKVTLRKLDGGEAKYSIFEYSRKEGKR